MSRLDSSIRRLQAQRACLDWAAGKIRDKYGPILELGLGNGRTYDHLRHCLPDREIFVFEREVAAHPECIPDEEHLFLGDIYETLPFSLDRIGTPAVLAHCDIGSGDKELNAEIANFIGPVLPSLLAPVAVVAADQVLTVPGFIEVDLPAGVATGRYHLYLKGFN